MVGDSVRRKAPIAKSNSTVSGYSGTPLWKKLGYKPELTAHVDGAPDNYPVLLGLPEGVEVKWLSRPKSGMQFVHLFATEKSIFSAKLNSLRKQIAPDAMVWVSWPKKSSGVATDITEHVVREVALPTGLVDIKVCAVDETWSGLKLMIRKELR